MSVSSLSRPRPSRRSAIVLDGEIAVPDERGVTNIADLQDAIAQRRAEQPA
jgi:hypothetical protein